MLKDSNGGQFKKKPCTKSNLKKSQKKTCYCQWDRITSQHPTCLIMKNVNAHAPIYWHGWPWPHEWRGRAQPPRCQPELPSASDSSLQEHKTCQQNHTNTVILTKTTHIHTNSKQRSWKSTCGSVGCVGIASSLDKLGRKAVLIKRSAVHDWSVILKWVYRGIWRHGDILQGQPESRAALMVLKLEVKSDVVDR